MFLNFNYVPKKSGDGVRLYFYYGPDEYDDGSKRNKFEKFSMPNSKKIEPPVVANPAKPKKQVRFNNDVKQEVIVEKEEQKSDDEGEEEGDGIDDIDKDEAKIYNPQLLAKDKGNDTTFDELQGWLDQVNKQYGVENEDILYLNDSVVNIKIRLKSDISLKEFNERLDILDKRNQFENTIKNVIEQKTGVRPSLILFSKGSLDINAILQTSKLDKDTKIDDPLLASLLKDLDFDENTEITKEESTVEKVLDDRTKTSFGNITAEEVEKANTGWDRRCAEIADIDPDILNRLGKNRKEYINIDPVFQPKDLDSCDPRPEQGCSNDSVAIVAKTKDNLTVCCAKSKELLDKSTLKSREEYYIEFNNLRKRGYDGMVQIVYVIQDNLDVLKSLIESSSSQKVNDETLHRLTNDFRTLFSIMNKLLRNIKFCINNQSDKECFSLHTFFNQQLGYFFEYTEAYESIIGGLNTVYYKTPISNLSQKDTSLSRLGKQLSNFTGKIRSYLSSWSATLANYKFWLFTSIPIFCVVLLPFLSSVAGAIAGGVGVGSLGTTIAEQAINILVDSYWTFLCPIFYDRWIFSIVSTWIFSIICRIYDVATLAKTIYQIIQFVINLTDGGVGIVSGAIKRIMDYFKSSGRGTPADVIQAAAEEMKKETQGTFFFQRIITSTQSIFFLLSMIFYQYFVKFFATVASKVGCSVGQVLSRGVAYAGNVTESAVSLPFDTLSNYWNYLTGGVNTTDLYANEKDYISRLSVDVVRFIQHIVRIVIEGRKEIIESTRNSEYFISTENAVKAGSSIYDTLTDPSFEKVSKRTIQALTIAFETAPVWLSSFGVIASILGLSNNNVDPGDKSVRELLKMAEFQQKGLTSDFKTFEYLS
jgi:hypothetical protein